MTTANPGRNTLPARVQTTPLRRTALVLMLSASLGLGIAGCAGETEEQLLASARNYISQNDNPAAVIQLKNALQKNGDSAQGRLLLGQVMLKMGDAASAAVELGKARALNVPDDQVVPDLARALLLSGQDDKVLSEFANLKLQTPAASAQLATQLASAYMVRGNAEKTEEFAQIALQAVSTYAPAITLQARVRASKGEIPAALALLDGVLAREEAHLEAGLFRGEILRSQPGGLAPALAQYQAVVAKHPDSIAARSAEISTLLMQGDKAAAEPALAAMAKLAPGHPDTLFFQAQLAYDAGNFTQARSLTEQVLKMVPSSLRALELAAAAAYRSDDYAQAELFLTQALKLAPGQLLARHMLAQTYVRIGQPDRALETLKPLLDAPRVNANTLALAGEVFLTLGDAKRSEEAFAAAAKMLPDDIRLRTSLAMSQVLRSKGSAETMQSLEALTVEDSSPRADLALVSAKLGQRDYPGALKALEGLQKKQPERAAPDNLRGQVLFQQGDKAAARTSFEAALKKEPKFLPAAINLAALDLADGQREAAIQRLKNMAAADPGNPDVHVARAELASRTGAGAAEVASLLGEAIRANAAAPRAHVALVTHWLATGDARSALNAAQAGAAALPQNADVQDALGRALMANGDRQQALSIWRTLASQQPKQPSHHLHMAEAMAANGNYDEAQNSLRRALEIQPTLLAAERALVTVALQRGKPEQGLPVARNLQQRMPKEALGWILEGDIEAARKNNAAAIAAYRTAVQRNAPTEAAIRLHRSLQVFGPKAEADSFAAQWQKNNPTDGTFRFYLGDIALASRDLPAAEAHYRAVLEATPGNALAMNNIAWIMATLGKPGAVDMANKANELAPDSAPVLDTLALALASEGQLPQAIEIQKRALAQAPTDPGMKLNLAKLHIKSGNKSFARAELEDVASMGNKFKGHAEVTELLKQVR